MGDSNSGQFALTNPGGPSTPIVNRKGVRVRALSALGISNSERWKSASSFLEQRQGSPLTFGSFEGDDRSKLSYPASLGHQAGMDDEQVGALLAICAGNTAKIDKRIQSFKGDETDTGEAPKKTESPSTVPAPLPEATTEEGSVQTLPETPSLKPQKDANPTEPQNQTPSRDKRQKKCGPHRPPSADSPK